LGIIDKITKIKNILENEYINDDKIDICNIELVRYFDPVDIEYFIRDYIPSLPYKCKGIYFTPINKKYANLLYIFNNNEINNNKLEKTYDDIIDKRVIIDTDNKEKLESSNSKKIIHIEDIDSQSDEEESDQSIVFKIIKTKQPDIYELHANNNSEEIYHSIAYLPTLKISKILNNAFSENETKEMYCRCLYSLQFNKWIPEEIVDEEECDSIEKVYKITNKLNKNNSK